MLREVLIQFATGVSVALVPTIATLVAAVLIKLLQRLNLNLDAQTEAKLQHSIEQAILSVEERVSAGQKVDKLGAAIRVVQTKYPKLPVTEIEAAIHSKLAEFRADVANQLFPPKTK